MNDKELHVVTGAYGYSGKYITQRLLKAGHAVRTLTNSPERANPFGDQVEAHLYNFDNPAALVASLEGAKVFYITYWVRFNHKDFSHADAVANTKILFDAAQKAGVERVIYISITHADEDSPLEYFSGKGELERVLRESGLSYAILRPTVLFGQEDILVNNIAWTLRRLPVFGVFGDGEYRLQPIYVDDQAKLAVEQGQSRENVVIDAIGPETFTYRELVKTIGQIIGHERPIISVPPRLGYLVGSIMGRLVGDVLITKEEIEGLTADLLYTDSPPAGQTKLTDWAREHAEQLGREYASELARRRDRKKAYSEL